MLLFICEKDIIKSSNISFKEAQQAKTHCKLPHWPSHALQHR